MKLSKYGGDEWKSASFVYKAGLSIIDTMTFGSGGEKISIGVGQVYYRRTLKDE